MKNRLQQIEFDCPECHEELEVSPRSAGTTKNCPACNAPVTVPGERKSVKVKMGIGKVAALETEVSRQDAGRMAHTFLGGLLALAGVMICAMLGLRRPKS